MEAEESIREGLDRSSDVLGSVPASIGFPSQLSGGLVQIKPDKSPQTAKRMARWEARYHS